MYSKNSWVCPCRPSQSCSAGVVLPAGLDRVVGEVHVVLGGQVLAEDERDLVGELLRIRGGHAEDANPEVL